MVAVCMLTSSSIVASADEIGESRFEEYDVIGASEGVYYHVAIENLEVLYDDIKEDEFYQGIPYYLHTYFNLCTGDTDARYNVQFIRNSVKYDKDNHTYSMICGVNKYPTVEIKVEYNKRLKIFGISSELGDYSLSALRRNGRGAADAFRYDEGHDGNFKETPYGEGDVFISQHGSRVVNNWLHFNSNGLADSALNYKSSYSKTQIKQMLGWLDELCVVTGDKGGDVARKNSSYFKFEQNAVDDVYNWHVRTGYDPMVFFAIIKTEGALSTEKGKKYYNFGNVTGEPVIPGSKHGFKNCLPEVQRMVDQGKCKSLQGAALVLFMDDIATRYFEGKGQITYYRMSFGGYGFDFYDFSIDTSRYPKNWDDAEKEAANMTHCYCPWWDDPAYLANYNSQKIWCNQCARFLEEISTRVR